nr:iron chelate uptake ABC transporter family permease subunit [Vibrio campbellii]
MVRSLATALLLAVVYASLSSGIYHFDAQQIMAFLISDSSSQASLVFWELRLPRTLIALFGGAALAVSRLAHARHRSQPVSVSKPDRCDVWRCA